MHQSIPEQGKWLKQVVTGYFVYHAVPTNAAALATFRDELIARWRWVLRRRRLAGPPARLLGRCELILDRSNQPVVLRQTKYKMHSVRLTPSHQLVARKAAVGTQQNPHLRPAAANLPDNAGHLLHGTVGRIHARAPQLRCQQMPPAENVKRQITVAVIIAVKEPALLAAVHRIIGRIKVKNDFVRRTAPASPEK